MNFSALQIANLVNGKIEGDDKVKVSSFAGIDEAKSGQLTFLANPKYEDFIYTTNASIILIKDDLALKQPVAATLIRVKDTYSALASILTEYNKLKQNKQSGLQKPTCIAKSTKLPKKYFIGAFTFIGDNVKLGENITVHPQVYIGDNVAIGDNVVLYQGVKIYHDCVIGNNVIIHAGSIIGSDGFGFAIQSGGGYNKVQQIGNVIIEDEVEIGANVTIDRATFGSTKICRGAKLDNLIQIAHNVEIGENTVIAAQVGISGSTKIGKNVMIGGQAGVVGHIQIGDGAKINAQSGVIKTMQKNEMASGSPAIEYAKFYKSYVVFKKLPELDKKISEIEKKMNNEK